MPKFGDFVRKERESRGWTQQQLAQHMDGSLPNVQRIERMAAPSVQGRTYAWLAKALGLTTTELDLAWKGKGKPTRQKAHETHPSLGAPIPIINQVFASRFAEKTNMDYVPGLADGYAYAPQVTDKEAFAWVVEGECMEPDYYPGEIVICSPNAPFVAGADYFVQLTPDRDSVSTFKRVTEARDGYQLEAVNPAFAKSRLWVAKSEIFTMARALYVQRTAGPRKRKV